jgi:hypothetical protein
MAQSFAVKLAASMALAKGAPDLISSLAVG